MARKTAGTAEKRGEGNGVSLQVAHRIEVLLHTMRAIERHEEQLCTVMTEIRNEGDVSAGTRRELESLLMELPSKAYQADLDAVAAALQAVKTGSGRVTRSGGGRDDVTAKAKAKAGRK